MECMYASPSGNRHTLLSKQLKYKKIFTKRQVWVIRILSKPDKIFGPIGIRFRQVTLYVVGLEW